MMKGIITHFSLLLSLSGGLLMPIDTHSDTSAPHGEYILKVMSYNIKGIPLPWVTHGKRYARIGKAIAQMRAEGKGPQILGLQEAFLGKTRDVSKNNTFLYRQRGPNSRPGRINSGIEVLSDFQIIDARRIVYSKCINFDCLSNKGAMFSRIVIPELPFAIDLYNTHMNADPGGYKVRPQQAREMTDFILQTHDQNNLLLAIGDFNFRQPSPEYHYMAEQLDMQNAVQECGILKDCSGTPDPLKEWEHMIDHQFYRSPQSGQVEVRPIHFELLWHDPTDGHKWSDHDAVLIYYRIRW